MLKKISFLLLSLSLLAACSGGDVVVHPLASDSFDSTQTFKLNPLDSIATNATHKQTKSIPDNNGTAYDSLTVASADAASNGSALTFILPALAVQKNDISNYSRSEDADDWSDANSNQTVTVSRVSLPAMPFISFTFNDAGAISAATVYFADKTYMADSSTDISNKHLSANIMGDDIAGTTNITVDRRSGFFGFDTDHMVYISWSMSKRFSELSTSETSDSIYDHNGSMIAGIETAITPMQGIAQFIGKGGGIYGNRVTNYKTKFNVVADVDFSENIVSINMNATCKIVDCANEALNHLDFTVSELSFTAGAITAANVITDTDLSGRLDARFYGNAGDGANEFGGTFAMVANSGSDSGSYYYGAFGAERSNIFIKDNSHNINFDTPSFTQENVSIPQSNFGTEYTSLHEASNDADTPVDKPFVLKSLLVQKNHGTDYERPSSATDWSDVSIDQMATISRSASSALSLTFNDVGEISVVTAHFAANENYQADIGNNALSKTSLTGIIGNEAVSDADSTEMIADRSSDFFGFNSTAKYMVYVNWLAVKEFDDAVTESMQSMFSNEGMMIAGMETDVMNIPASGTLLFEGKGRGTYSNLDDNENYATRFTIKADVDFTALDVDVQTLGTLRCSDTSDISTCNIAVSALDFSATGLSFDDGTATAKNAISGAVKIGDLAGTIDARFYGSSGAEEFGGTFAMRDINRYYYGAFGGYDFGFANLATSGTASNPRVAVNHLTYDSFKAVSDGAINDAANKEITLPALAVHYTSIMSPASTTIERIARKGDDSPIVKLTFNSSGHISAARTYFADQSYGMAQSASDSKQIIHDNSVNDITTEVTLIGSATDFDLQLTRVKDATLAFAKNLMIYDFEPKYMMIGWWQIENAAGDRDAGSMVTGFKTSGTGTDGIPIKESAEFTGGSIGFYRSNSENFQTKSVITIDVDFIARTVALLSDETRECPINPDSCTIEKPELNFSTADDTAPKYNIGDNNISSVITTTENDNMLGRFDAHFYGDGAEEMGGTFIMKSVSDDQKYYMGAFITKR